MTRTRCAWGLSDPLYLTYHDKEWGVPQHDDRRLFEMLILEGSQAGLSWLTVLKKRPYYQQAFDKFDPQRVARYSVRKTAQLLANDKIIRNRLKISSAISNARAFLVVQKEFETFDEYIWAFVDGEPRQRVIVDVPFKPNLGRPKAFVVFSEVADRGLVELVQVSGRVHSSQEIS